jgi:hypothetical protein
MENQETIVELLCFSKGASSPGSPRNSGVRESSQQQSDNEKNQRRWSRWVAETIAPSPVSSNGMDTATSRGSLSSYSNRLTDIADRWSQLTFFQEVEGRQQHHVSLVLWHGLVILDRCSVDSLKDPSHQKLTAALVRGVSHRLGSILPTLRKDGMRIAQQLAKGLGQDGVRFDEFESDDDSDSENVESKNLTCDTNNDRIDRNPTKTIEKIDQGQPRHGMHGFVNPDADYDSDAEEGDDISDEIDRGPHTSATVSLDAGNRDDPDKINNDDDAKNEDLSVEWKDEFIPYDLEDDEEDLRETPKPLQLLEALELLRTGENHDQIYNRHEVALETLQSLIRKRPDDLADVAVSLALELLRMEDKFNIENFNTNRESAIRALLVEESFSVGHALIQQLFEESGLADKLLILASLQSAASELSGNKAPGPAVAKPTSLKNKSGFIGQPDDDLLPANQASRVLSKTRRKRSRSQRKSMKNNFSNTAPMWFYSLIAGFLKHREDETLWTGSTGSILLAYFFRCLATIVEFSGFQASQVLANDLLDLVWDFRTADVPEVRLSALIAVSTSIAMLSDEKLMSLLFDEANLPQALHEMSRRDPDKECRSLCQTLSLSIHNMLKTSNF